MLKMRTGCWTCAGNFTKEPKMLDCRFHTSSTRLDHYIANTLNRIHIVPCLSSNDLYHILSMIYEKKYKGDSIYHLSIVTIHIFSSLFDDSSPSYVKIYLSIFMFRTQSFSFFCFEGPGHTHELCHFCTFMAPISSLLHVIPVGFKLSDSTFNFKRAFVNPLTYLPTPFRYLHEAVFDPFLETDNAVFSKLSELWHSIVDTRGQGRQGRDECKFSDTRLNLYLGVS
ncbi:hypothetical protein TOT_040000643 [Theileria orientalis strain Shintoku]|uniref:Uncharacterized protein n=1 Tax=Theileria orientalis strain Shintoku TaxID=869250 RepID=J4DQD7_THEOR|nr:LOW QUALITY PROTEIN: hypothetical protein TOT_040000643 [Theileria orientalis strain Shintoku]BAM42274.1 hypothetical protein TOT_040000643 [Theileria orientalis strain Shintoku]|eukprot:XP_009692575.1 LOW QUALITY PROTEIN: hypothetical protein TOT_040000643 [Theileria orientalis strain Shintoku]